MLIFSSSITRDIYEQTINKHCTNGTIQIHKFNGKKAKYITQYMIPHMAEENPHTVVLVAGGNGIPNKAVSDERLVEIADYLVEGAKKCKEEYGVSNVIISSVLPRRDSVFQRNRHILNRILKTYCSEYGLTFLENENIILKNHVCYDGTHLNSLGSDVFSDNLLQVLNT